jgi:hypothetical protein
MRARNVLVALVLLACTASQGWAQAAVDSPTDTPPEAVVGVPSGDAAQPVSPGAADPASAQPVIPGTTQSVAAGVSGRIVVEGRCPVPLGGDDVCPTRPFPTTVLIRGEDDQRPVASVPTAADGTFAVALPPGRYHVDPLLADGNPPAASSIVVDVTGDSVLSLTIRVRGGLALLGP